MSRDFPATVERFPAALPPLVVDGHPRRRGVGLLSRSEPERGDRPPRREPSVVGPVECRICRAMTWGEAVAVDGGYVCRSCGRAASVVAGAERAASVWDRFVRWWAGIGGGDD